MKDWYVNPLFRFVAGLVIAAFFMIWSLSEPYMWVMVALNNAIIYAGAELVNVKLCHLPFTKTNLVAYILGSAIGIIGMLALF